MGKRSLGSKGQNEFAHTNLFRGFRNTRISRAGRVGVGEEVEVV
jgi:hypothetical protein